MRKNNYFEKYCEIATWLLSRDDIENPAIKSAIRFTIREAINHATNLPGYDNKKGAEVVSSQAKEQISTGDLNNLVGEHIVPVSVVNKSLIKMLPLKKEEIMLHLKKFSKRAVITKVEDTKLKEAGLAKSMPSNWNGDTEMDRYEKVGINVLNLTYLDALKNV